MKRDNLHRGLVAVDMDVTPGSLIESTVALDNLLFLWATVSSPAERRLKCQPQTPEKLFI